MWQRDWVSWAQENAELSKFERNRRRSVKCSDALWRKERISMLRLVLQEGSKAGTKRLRTMVQCKVQRQIQNAFDVWSNAKFKGRRRRNHVQNSESAFNLWSNAKFKVDRKCLRSTCMVQCQENVNVHVLSDHSCVELCMWSDRSENRTADWFRRKRESSYTSNWSHYKA